MVSLSSPRDPAKTLTIEFIPRTYYLASKSSALPNELQLYIEELEAEAETLQLELNRCVAEGDYKYASHNQRALGLVLTQLKTIKNLIASAPGFDGQQIDDALIELRDGKIKGFTLMLQPHQDLYLSFTRQADGNLYCELPTKAELNNAYSYWYHSKISNKQIKRLGFAKNKERNKRFGLLFTIPSNNSCIEIKTKLALLLYDIFHVAVGSKAILIKH